MPRQNVPVAGCPLPPIEHIQWKAKRDRPGWYAWHAPQGSKAPRSSKTYLGYVGKKLLAEWEAMPPGESEQVIRQWVADRLAGKGNN